VRENKSGVIPTLTANMGTGGHNVPLVKTRFGIRKLTPNETFKAQGYPLKEDGGFYELPEGLSNGQLYKEAGNSVVIPVIKRIATNIDKALEKIGSKDEKLPKTNDLYAVTYTKMNGRMEGESFTKEWFATEDEARKFIRTLDPELPVVEKEDFYALIRKGGNNEFYSVVG